MRIVLRQFSWARAEIPPTRWFESQSQRLRKTGWQVPSTPLEHLWPQTQAWVDVFVIDVCTRLDTRVWLTVTRRRVLVSCQASRFFIPTIPSPPILLTVRLERLALTIRRVIKVAQQSTTEATAIQGEIPGAILDRATKITASSAHRSGASTVPIHSVQARPGSMTECRQRHLATCPAKQVSSTGLSHTISNSPSIYVGCLSSINVARTPRRSINAPPISRHRSRIHFTRHTCSAVIIQQFPFISVQLRSTTPSSG